MMPNEKEGRSHQLSDASTTDGLPVAPSMGPALHAAHLPRWRASVSGRDVVIGLLALVLGAIAWVASFALTGLIGLFTNFAFYGRFAFDFVPPSGNTLGPLVVLVPVAGALVVGVMARYGSQAIRGHGIPEAMEQILINQSRIPPRLTILKPLSAAVSIGTGGPFGAEGPIIATGGALGSLVGQALRTTSDERKTLLAAGAAAGMAATFGSPVAAVLIALELLLFEYSPRSLVPVAFASATATALRLAMQGAAPVFPTPELAFPGLPAHIAYLGIGGVLGLVAVGITRIVYGIEDLFSLLPIHWMWWPALGAVAVGVVGFVAPDTLGVGYYNIENMLAGKLAIGAALALCALKFVSWSISLGSGTSGGTLAPLFTFGAGLGAAIAAGFALVFPSAGIDPRLGALVGMASLFAGSSRAFLASAVFAFETTHLVPGILPLLCGCSGAYLVASLVGRHSIMTEKIERRGVRVPGEFAADFLARVSAGEGCTRAVVAFRASDSVDGIRHRLASLPAHQGFPVLAADGSLVGVLTRAEIERPDADPLVSVGDLVQRRPIVVFEDTTLREAADIMLVEDIGRLPVVDRSAPARLVGILTRTDLLNAHRRRLEESGRHGP